MTKTHFFGEMELDLSKTPDKIYKEAFRIAECCGYGIDTTKQEDNVGSIDLYGEDCHDSLQVVNRINIADNKVTKCQKVVYRITGWNDQERREEKQLIQVYELIKNEWTEIFNMRKSEEALKN